MRGFRGFPNFASGPVRLSQNNLGNLEVFPAIPVLTLSLHCVLRSWMRETSDSTFSSSSHGGVAGDRR